MKGAPGLIVALLFGGLGVALNYLYLYNKGKDVESISFLGVREGTTISVRQTQAANRRNRRQIRLPPHCAV